MTSDKGIYRINCDHNNIRFHLIEYDDFLFSNKNIHRIHRHLSPYR